MKKVVLDGGRITIEQVCAVAEGAPVEASAAGLEAAAASRRMLEAREDSGEQIYGVTTGFGPLKSEVIPRPERVHLQENLVRSHAVGVGEFLPPAVTRAAMTLLAASHLRGHSGVGPEAALALCELLNLAQEPSVRSMGSLGASGDLAPLAHLALALMGEEGGRTNGASLKLTSKMGLSLINGTHFHTGIAALLVPQSETLAKAADIACAMNLEAMLCSEAPFREDVQQLRPHPHQLRSAANVRRLVSGSEITASHAGCGELQDAYSIRCAPQVHGAARQAIAHLRDVVEIELASVTDNPLVVGEQVVSAGHFHGEPVGLALDYLKIGISELAAISERRAERALNKDYNRGLPAFLVTNPGLNSGLMMCQYTAAALVSENKVLAHPSCVDSITTGANQEDHVSMAMNAALHAQRVLKNVRDVIGIELIVAAQALDCRRAIQPDKPGRGVATAWRAVREQSSHVETDRSLSDELNRFSVEAVVGAVESDSGGLE